MNTFLFVVLCALALVFAVLSVGLMFATVMHSIVFASVTVIPFAGALICSAAAFDVSKGV